LYIITERRIRDEKIKQLKAGRSAYAESEELIRLLTREIEKHQLSVIFDRTNTGCWFIPIPDPENGKQDET
jgi:hypothetical protein